MCPEGIVPCKTFGGIAFGAAFMGTTEVPWICSGALVAGAETGTICNTKTTCQKIKRVANLRAFMQPNVRMLLYILKCFMIITLNSTAGCLPLTVQLACRRDTSVYTKI